ncbi:MAG: hypothetical protein NTU83_01305 [Candidatus Hydrogenedentes bacterium]|nr:hypothetical protein [Candidatus Hydrogenedentota bacterium]
MNQRLDVRVILTGVLVSGLALAAAPAPELKIIPQQGPAHPYHAYRVVCEVSWTGSPSDFSILPAEADAIDWGTVRVSDVRAFVRDGVNVVSQTLEIVPNKTGEFQSPKIRVRYLIPEATPPAEKPAPGTVPPDSGASPSLGADPFNIVVRSSTFYVWISGGLGASLLLTALGWRSVRFSRRPQPPLTTAGADLSHIQHAMHAARQHRLDGDFYNYYHELHRTAQAIPLSDSDHANRIATLAARMQEVGYRGVRPTDDQMDGDWRDIERALAHYKESLQS